MLQRLACLGHVCDSYCLQPASTPPYVWNDSIVDWPVKSRDYVDQLEHLYTKYLLLYI